MLGGDRTKRPAIQHRDGVDVCAGIIIVPLLQKRLSRVLDSGTIISSQREQVKLEENIHLLQTVIIF